MHRRAAIPARTLQFCSVAMDTHGSAPVILLVSAERPALADLLLGHPYAVLHARTGTLGVDWAQDIQPDLVVLDAELPDMTGVAACRELRGNLRVGPSVPVLIRTETAPTPEQRVAVLRAGAWDFVTDGEPPSELVLRVQTYVQAKRNIDRALANGMMDPTTQVHSRSGIARRARELGALLARSHSGLGCLVFALEPPLVDAKAAGLIVSAARLSDVVGALGPTELAVLAPATDEAGIIKLARRVARALHEGLGAGPAPDEVAGLRCGYDVIANLRYAPVDPVELVTRASAAVKNGRPERHAPWMRRYDAARAGHRTPAGSAAGERRMP